MGISNSSDIVLWRFSKVVLLAVATTRASPSHSLLQGYSKLLHSALKFALGHITKKTKGEPAEASPVIAISEQLRRSTFSQQQKENVIDTITGAQPTCNMKDLFFLQ